MTDLIIGLVFGTCIVFGVYRLVCWVQEARSAKMRIAMLAKAYELERRGLELPRLPAPDLSQIKLPTFGIVVPFPARHAKPDKESA